MIFNVKAFGAAGDGVTDDTKAIQSAIDSASAQGGRVVLDDGIYFCGTLYLKSDISIELGSGAVIAASGNISDYGTDTHHNRYRNEPELDRCFIFAQDAENIEICGGEINGSAESFPNKGSIYRPMMLRFLNCRSIHIHDIKLYNSASWTTAFLDCSDIFASGIDIKNEKNYNGDGLDFDGCKNVFVTGCRILGTDDNLCLQSSGLTVQNVHISDCTFSSICAAIRIGLKSAGDITNVNISNCRMENVWREGIKIECTEGGRISDINICGIDMHNVTRPVFVLLNNRFEPDDLGSSLELTEMPAIGRLENITLSDISAADDDEMKNTHLRFGNDIMGSPRFAGFRFDAEENHPIKNLILRNIRYDFIGGVKLSDIPSEYPRVIDRLKDKLSPTSENYYPDWSRASFMDIRNVAGLTLKNVSCRIQNPDERRRIIFEGCILTPQSDKPENS